MWESLDFYRDFVAVGGQRVLRVFVDDDGKK
jgi:hypothetical protein